MKEKVNIFWFRRDLRLHDNAGLYHALKEGTPVLPVFIFDKDILDKLEDSNDKRVAFIYSCLEELQQQLVSVGSGLFVYYGYPIDVFRSLNEEFAIQKVFTNHDYEPYALERDGKVAEFLSSNQISFHTSKDQVIFEKSEILKENNTPYTVFTPYSRKWKSSLNDFYLSSYPTEKYF
ncbi:MAG TPA: deoxyribodipyrimidine photo-lyase, partial [Segetibacter sp.]|nr:deoxyribodipyrimidine photo-lyase [Segetibacter sp.]